jgi:DNA modification methylase
MTLPTTGHLAAMIQTQIIYCGDNLQKLRELPDACVDLIYIDPPFNSNRNYEVFWGDTQEERAFGRVAVVSKTRPRPIVQAPWTRRQDHSHPAGER